MSEKKSAGGLADIIAGETAIATVGKEGAGLTYRGFDIEDMAKNATFNEVAYLLHHGDLPNSGQLELYLTKLKGMRGLPQALKDVLETTPASSHPMDVLRTGCSVLGNIEPEGDFSRQADIADRLLACFPSMLMYWHRYHTDGVRIDTETEDDSIAGHFLHLLHGKPPSDFHRRVLDISLMLSVNADESISGN